MRVVITGATGNHGTSLIDRLASEDAVQSILGLARRVPDTARPKTEWARADVSEDDLVPLVRGADAVVHLAWEIQPSRDEEQLRRTNVQGSRRVFEAAAAAGVPAIVYASSVGTYASGPKDRPVDESWPATGIPTSFYSRHKAEVEAILDLFEPRHPGIRVVRIRPGLVFKRGAADSVRRLFMGPFVPRFLVRRSAIPVVPDAPGLRVQAVHSRDLAEAYRLALVRDVRGAFNVAAEPPLDPATLSRALGARRVRVPARVLRGLASATWRLHLQPTPPGWVDMAFGVPVMDTRRAREELGWEPLRTAEDALLELLEGIHDAAGEPTPHLDPRTSGPARIRELIRGVGHRNP